MEQILRKISKFPEILGELSMRKQCVPGSFLSAHALEPENEARAPPNLLCPTPWYYAWMIRNFINVHIFRVRPCACFMKGTMKRQKSI